VRAENPVTVSEQHVPRGDSDITVPTTASMIARRGPRTRLPDARSHAGLAGAACPLRHRQRRRDPHAAPRSRRAAPHPPATHTHLARPRSAQRAEHTAPSPAAPTAAGLAPNAAALARPTRCYQSTSAGSAGRSLMLRAGSPSDLTAGRVRQSVRDCVTATPVAGGPEG